MNSLCCRGHHLHITSWYDNSPGNKFNPDADNTITYGQRTIDEMGAPGSATTR